MLWPWVALVLSALVFVPGLVEQFEVPKVAVVRVCGAAALASWLIRRPWRRRRLGAYEWALLGWIATEAIATLASVSPRLSVFGDALQHEGLLTSVALAALALEARDGLRSPRAFAVTLDLGLAAAALACVYAMLQVAHLDPLPWSRTATYGGAWVRPFGTLGHPNLLGAVSAAAGAWATALAIARPERRWVYAPLALLLAMATMLTFSRAAWLGAAAGIPVALVLVAIGRGSLRIRTRAVLGMCVIAATVVALFWFGGWSRLLGSRAGELARGGGATGSSRVEIWRTALRAAQARPLVGHGPATFELVFPRYQTPEYWRHEWSGLPFHAHSLALQTLATRGLLGGAAAAAIVVAVLAATRRAWRTGGEARAWIAPLIGGLVAIGVTGLTGAIGVAAALWALLSASALDAAAAGGRGPASAMKDRSGSPTPVPRESPTRRRAWSIALPLVAAVIVAVPSWADLRASRALSLARHASEADPARALAAAEAAIAFNAGDDSALQTLADARMRMALRAHDRAMLERAEQAALQATTVEPLRYLAWQGLGAVRAARVLEGDPAALAGMEAAYARAAELAPVNALVMTEHARWEILLDRPQQAMPLMHRATALYPDEAPLRATLASALLASGDRAGARAELERALRSQWRGRDSERQAAEEVLARLAPAPDSTAGR